MIQKHYLNFNLEDKVGFNRGGFVRDSRAKAKETERPSNKEEESKSIVCRQGTPNTWNKKMRHA